MTALWMLSQINGDEECLHVDNEAEWDVDTITS